MADGDTITVLSAGQPVKVRLAGIDCPEKGQPFGKRAKQYTSDVCFHTIVTVRITDHDRYGRTVGVVTLVDGRELNRDLVEVGLAWWYRKYAPGDKELEKAEEEAQELKVGLWREPNPVPPWEWRRSTHKKD